MRSNTSEIHQEQNVVKVERGTSTLLSNFIDFFTLYKLCAVKSRVCSNKEAHHQCNRGCVVQASRLSSFCSTPQKYLPMNEPLLLLVYQVKMVSNLWHGRQKSIN